MRLNEFGGPRLDQFPFQNATADANPSGNSTEPVATTCYKGNAGDPTYEQSNNTAPHNQPAGFWTHDPKVNCYRGVDCFGIFWRYSYFKGGVKIREIIDGTSKTILVGEASPEDGNSSAWSSDGDWALASVQLNWDWRTAGVCLNANGEPDFARPECYTQIRGFRSYHPGGVHFAMADGSVRFISDDIEHLTFRASSTKNWGEVVGSY